MMPIKTYKKIETIVLYFVIRKNLEISFQNRPEHEATSLRMCSTYILNENFDSIRIAAIREITKFERKKNYLY